MTTSSNPPGASTILQRFVTGYLITNVHEFPQHLRTGVDVNNPLSVLSSHAKIGYVNLSNFNYQRSRLVNVEGKLRTSVEVNGWILKFYHVFDTLENANKYLTGIHKQIYDENTALRGFELAPISTTVTEITFDEWLLIWENCIQGTQPNFDN